MKQFFKLFRSTTIIIVVILLTGNSLRAQPAIIAPTNYNFPFGAISLPILGANWTAVSTLSVELSYYSSALAYTGYQYVNPALASGFLSINEIGGVTYDSLVIAWFSVTPATIVQGSLFDLMFNYTGCTPLLWSNLGTGFVTMDGYICNTSGISDPESSPVNNPVLVAPNPATDHVTFTFNSLTKDIPLRLEIYDNTGKNADTKMLIPVDGVITYSTGKLANGMYLGIFKNELGEVGTVRFVVGR